VTRSTNDGARQSKQGPEASRFGMVGTYVPTECGIATFAAALRTGMIDASRARLTCQVVRLVDEPLGDGGPEVLAELLRGSRGSTAKALAALNELDVAVVQHEYGIYGEDDGAEVIDIVRGIDPASIVLLNTVVENPTPNQRRSSEFMARGGDALVTMSRTA